MSWFDDYKTEFEKAVIQGAEQRFLGSKKQVPIIEGKLNRKRIGREVGVTIETDTVLVIDYYGFMKRSRGFQNMVASLRDGMSGKQVKMVDAHVVHFNSIRLEVIAKINPSLVERFVDFKAAVLDAREFPHRYKNKP